MLVDFLRIIGVALVGLMLVLPSGEYLDALSQRETQVIIGFVVIISTLFVDPIFGALLGLVVLIWLFKMNARVLTVKALTKKRVQTNTPIIYGTPKNLVDAQTNVVNPKMMDTEMIGFEGIHGEQVIGAQGLDKNMPGFDKNNIGQMTLV